MRKFKKGDIVRRGNTKNKDLCGVIREVKECRDFYNSVYELRYVILNSADPSNKKRYYVDEYRASEIEIVPPEQILEYKLLGLI